MLAPLPVGYFACVSITAPMVLYYNKPLMDKFGYHIPTTWQEYLALGERTGSEYPGYIIGSFGDAWAFKAYFDASGCPSSRILNEKSVQINFRDTRCVRAAKWWMPCWRMEHLPPMAISTRTSSRLLWPIKSSCSWLHLGWHWLSFGGKPDSQYYNTADHQLGVAAPLRWKATPG